MELKYFDIHTHTYREEGIFSIFSVPVNTNEEDLPEKGMLSVGWHPWFLSANLEETILAKINLWSMHENVVAIGEAGLDRFSDVPFEYQKKIFLEQIHLSEKERKPLIIHCVKYFQELIDIKKQLNPEMTWIVHGFNNKIEIARQFLKERIKLSFGKALLNPDSNASTIISKFELSDFFLETDDSTEKIEEIYKIAASYCNISIQKLTEAQEENFKCTFNI